MPVKIRPWAMILTLAWDFTYLQLGFRYFAQSCMYTYLNSQGARKKEKEHALRSDQLFHGFVVKTAFFIIEIILSVFSIPLYIIEIGKMKKMKK